MHLIEKFEFPQEFKILTDKIKRNFDPHQQSRLL